MRLLSYDSELAKLLDYFITLVLVRRGEKKWLHALHGIDFFQLFLWAIGITELPDDLDQQKLLQAVDEKAESLRKVLEKYKKVPGDE